MSDAAWTDDQFGLWLGVCAGCDVEARVNDVGLCQECASKLERDLIRERSWEHSASAYALPLSEREALRGHVIRKHGAALELIAPLDRSGAHPRRKRRHENRA